MEVSKTLIILLFVSYINAKKSKSNSDESNDESNESDFDSNESMSSQIKTIEGKK